MLDNTNEINDIKLELKTYQVYGFADDAAFITALTYAVERAKRERMFQIFDESEYDALAAIGKASMDVLQYDIYYAEIYFSIAEFFALRDRQDKTARLGYAETQNQGGNSRVVSGYSGKDAAVREYLDKAYACLGRAGYSVNKKLQVISSIHGN